MTTDYQLSQLDGLQAESIHIIREVAAEFERPVLLFSGGKDSRRPAAPGREGLLAGADPVPGDARRHRPQLPRGARVPGPAGGRSGRAARRGQRCRTSSTAGRVAEDTGPGATRNRLQTRHAARRHRRARLRRRLRRGPPRRGEGPGQGAGALASATSSASGTRRTSGPSSGTSTTAGSARASTSGSSRCRTGPSSTSGTTSGARASSCPRSTSPTERKVFERDGMLLASSRGHARRRRGGRSRTTVRFRTVGDADLHRRGRVRCRHGRRRHRGGGRDPGHRARRDPRRRPLLARPPWRTARARGTSRCELPT